MKTKSIGLVWIVVKDFKRAIKYYTEVVGLKVMEISEEWGWAELEGHDGEGIRLGIAQSGQENPIQPGQNGVVTFTVANIDQARNEMQNQGAHLIGEVIEVPGHVKMQTVRDEDGNVFQIVEVLSLEKCMEKKSCCSH